MQLFIHPAVDSDVTAHLPGSVVEGCVDEGHDGGLDAHVFSVVFILCVQIDDERLKRSRNVLMSENQVKYAK